MIETVQNKKKTKWESYFDFAFADFGHGVMKSDVNHGHIPTNPTNKIQRLFMYLFQYSMQIIRFFLIVK